VEQRDVIAGDTVTLSCNVLSGTGNVTIRWIIDGRPVTNGPQGPTVFVSSNFYFGGKHSKVENRRIEIRGARLSDAGNFECVVENEAGQTRKMFELSVLGRLRYSIGIPGIRSIAERPRFLDLTNVNPSIIVGRPLVLDCSVAGTPRPAVTWTKVRIGLVMLEQIEIWQSKPIGKKELAIVLNNRRKRQIGCTFSPRHNPSQPGKPVGYDSS